MGMIVLDNMEFHACHGVYSMEKLVPQKFLLSLSIEFDLSKAGKSDQLEETIDYVKVVELCKAVMNSPKSLLEKIALEILKLLHERYPGIRFATVTIEKPEAQLGVKLNYVAVTVNSEDLN